MPSKHAYFDAGHFEDEQRRLFASEWHFVALATELAKDRDFVCLDYPGVAIVVQNFGGELRAFQNICTHRFNRIQTEDRGNRILLCSYHGWRYNQEGRPLGLSSRMGPMAIDQADLCLPSYAVERCGDFVFVRLGGEQTLPEQLGAFHAILEEISGYMGREIGFDALDHAANWKLLVENVLECYHCGIVHTETFVPFGVGKQPLRDVLIEGGHSSAHFPRTQMAREKLRQMYISHLAKRPFRHDSFYHIHIFPNLFIASTEGLAFYVGQALPTGPGTTRLRMRFLEPAVELSEKHRARQVPINDDNLTLSLKIVEEDRQILENIQRGIALTKRPGVLGVEEVRIQAFWDAYAARMRDDAATGPPESVQLAQGR